MTEQELTLLVGRLTGTMEAVQEDIKNMNESVNSLHKKVNQLPCTAHSQLLDTLKDCQDKYNLSKAEDNKIVKQSNMSLRNDIIIGVLTLFTGVIGTLITLYFTNIIGH
jgi:hypothetical protein